jgi:phosphoribosylglycinamide formyltransferase-1
MPMRRRRGTPPAVAVFASGKGTNLQALLDAQRRGRLRARIALVLSDQPGAGALARARRAGVQAHAIARADYPDRAAFERAFLKHCRAAGIRWICLAGFMRILSPAFVRAYRNRILNVHPALLPAFPGGTALRDALAWGAKVTGVTVHLVDEHVDHGPIILQEAVAIRAHDSEATLLARVHTVEHRLYVEALNLAAQGRIGVAGRVVKIRRR